MILVGGVFNSFGQALNNSTTTALAMDLADPARRGKAMATFSISFQLGVGIGAIIAGGLADTVGYRGMYAGSIAIIASGLALVLYNWRSLPAPDLVEAA
jgi:predicted MFS family arabinose efflux permease